MIRCTNCRRPYPDQGIPYRCPTCGGLYDYDSLPVFEINQLENGLPGIWRYRHSFGLGVDSPVVSLGEGHTPLVWSEVFGRRVAFKLEYINPTGSFKDRGSALIVSFLLSRKVDLAIEDSSGNAGSSFAAYAARAGIRSRVYLPETASGPKRKQIETLGAEVIPVSGPRSNAAEEVKRAADQGLAYASHAYLPFNLPGYATAAYEIYDQMGDAPGAIVLPIGQGGFLLGLNRGFAALQVTGLTSRLPAFVGVQARACAPLWALFTYGIEGLRWVSEGATIAEGVRVRMPLRGDAVIKAVEESGGTFIAVDEEVIFPGRDQLAHLGFYVEPTSAIVWDALSQVVDKVPQPIVVVLTGTGLKYTG